MTQDYFIFSGGEVHFKLKDDPKPIIVTDYTMNGFMALAQRIEILRRLGREKIDIVYPYFPYARQDRIMEEVTEPFSLKIFCEMVNALKVDSIEIWDPHSDVTPALLNNCKVIPQWELAMSTLPDEYFKKEIMFVSPDAGAYKKVGKLISDDSRILIGVKRRGAMGKISGTDVLFPTGIKDIKNKTCVIVDDICDGGRTFIELAKALKAKGAKRVILYITHGIFSQGFDELKKYIDRIHTTNSFNQQQTEFLFVREIL